MDPLTQLAEKICPEWISRPNPEFSDLEKINHIMEQIMPGHIGMKITSVGKKEVCGSILWDKQKSANFIGGIHGGATFTLGDTLAGVLLWVNSDGSYFGVTKSSQIQYFRPIRQGTLYCTVSECYRDAKIVKVRALFTDEKNHKISEMEIQFSLHKFIKKSSSSK